MRRQAITNLAVAAAATIAAIYAADLLLAWFPLPTPVEQRHARRERVARAAHVAVDNRSKANVVADLRRRGIDAWPALPGAAARDSVGSDSSLLPLGGISGVISVHCNELGQFVIYRADERGLTNPPGVWGVPRLDVALVGDSYVQGFCVPTTAAFPALIRARYPATVADGMAGSGPLVELGLLREYALPLRPRHVVWFYYESNDLVDLDAERGVLVLRRYLEPGFTQRLAARQDEVDARLRAFVDSGGRADSLSRARVRPPSMLGRLRKTVTLWHLREAVRTLRGSKPPRCCDLELFARVMRAAVVETRAAGGDFAFVYMPSQLSMVGSREARVPPWTLGDSVRTLMRGMNVPVLDLSDSLRRYGPVDSLYPYVESHLSRLGNRIVGDIILRYLARADSARPPVSAAVR